MPSRRPHLFILEEGKTLAPAPLYKERPPRERGHTIHLQEKRRAPRLELCLSPLCLSPLPLVRAPSFGASTEEKESSQAARRRAAGSPSPASLLPQLRWIGEVVVVGFHRTCAKPSRHCACGARCRAVIVDIKSAVEPSASGSSDLEVQEERNAIRSSKV